MKVESGAGAPPSSADEQIGPAILNSPGLSTFIFQLSTMAKKIRIKDRRAIETMRRAGGVVALVLDELARTAAPGVTTRDLDALAERLIRSHGGRAVFKNYPHPSLKNAAYPA